MSQFVSKLKLFFGFDEESSQEVEISPSPAPEFTHTAAPSIKSFKGTITPPSQSKKFPTSEITLHEPRIYEDSLSIATHLREDKPVIVNTKYLDESAGKRLIDFICGTAYAINGHMMKIGETIFLFTPQTILIVDHDDQTPLQKGIDQEEKNVFFNSTNY